MTEITIEKKYITLAEVMTMVEKEPQIALEVIQYALDGLRKRENNLKKKETNLWLVVKNIKPEYLEEMKKLIIPEIFENLNL